MLKPSLSCHDFFTNNMTTSFSIVFCLFQLSLCMSSHLLCYNFFTKIDLIFGCSCITFLVTTSWLSHFYSTLFTGLSFTCTIDIYLASWWCSWKWFWFKYLLFSHNNNGLYSFFSLSLDDITISVFHFSHVIIIEGFYLSRFLLWVFLRSHTSLHFPRR